MNKKLLATILASTMVLGSVSAYAAITPPTVSGTPVTVSGDALITTGHKINAFTEVASVEIKVTLPLRIDMLLNPYELDTKGQVLSPEYDIVNDGDTAINVTLTKWDVTTPTAANGYVPPTILAAKPADGSVKKEAYLYLQSNDGKGGTMPTELDLKEKAKIVPAKTTTAPLAVSYGTLGTETADKTLKVQFQGALSKGAVWEIKDIITASPTFKFTPTAVVK